jgi:glycosyltransferase involved in cell wall biosynthesis
MRKVIISVISKKQLANVAILMASAQTHLIGWDRIVFVLDLYDEQLNTENYEVFKNASYRSAENLIGAKYKDLAFFFLERELIEYVSIFAIKQLLSEYDIIALSGCEGMFFKNPAFLDDALTQKDIVIKLKNHIYTENEDIPETLLLFDETAICQSNLFAVSKGIMVLKFIDWCLTKFNYLINYALTSISKNNLHTSFINSWQQYACLFDLEILEAPNNIYFTLASSAKKCYQFENVSYINFKNYNGLDFHKNKLFSNTIITNYLNEAKKFDDNNLFDKTYPFDFFSDETKIHNLLRPYYFYNYRLRDKCNNNPFVNRELFTDFSIITGDERILPITAMADCIWKNRPDLQALFPLYKDDDRMSYIKWFLTCAAEEYKLPNKYTSALSEKYEYELKTINEVVFKNRFRTFLRKVLVKLKLVENGTNNSNNKIKVTQKYPAGINLCGFIRGEFGLGEATRILARTFESGNIPISIVNYSLLGIHKYTNFEFDAKITNEFKYNINLILINPDGIADFFDTISKGASESRYNIGFLYWELPEFPDSFTRDFNKFDEIWTASKFVADSIMKKTELPVFCLPCCVTVEYKKEFNRKHFNLPNDKFLFLMMYDVKSVQERKNPIAVIKAFQLAFNDNLDVTLVIKINGSHDMSIEDDLTQAVLHCENIMFVFGTFDKIEVNSLINCCDAFVSLHRSEGFGLGPAEAMYLGKPAILTNWSGNTDYMTDDNCCPVDYKIVEIEKDYGSYKKGNHWAEPSIEHAASYMKRLVENKDYYRFVSENGQKTIVNNFSPESICNLAKIRLHELNLL